MRKTSFLFLILLTAAWFLVPAATDMRMGGNFWFWTTWSPDKPFKDGVNFATTTDPWSPVFLEELHIYSLLRFMENNSTNNSGVSSWSQRREKTATVQEGTWHDANGGPGIACEWMIDLCNRTNTDLWTCIPHLAVTPALGNNPCDYALRLSILIKHGVDMKAIDLTPHLDNLASMTADELIALGGTRTCDGLNANLKFYIEYSNETWFGQFAAATHCNNSGAQLGLEGDVWGKGYQYHSWAAIRIWRAAELVFGEASERVVNVTSGLNGNSFMLVHGMGVVDNPAHNPWNVRPDAYAVAPYVGHNVTSMEDLMAAIAPSGAIHAQIRTICDQNNVQLIAYEAGQHVTSGADVINQDPRIYDFYTAYYDEMSKHFHLMANYCHCTLYAGGGAFGLKEYTGQPSSEAHKYRAVADWVAENVPQTAVAVPLRPEIASGRPAETSDRLVTLTGALVPLRPAGASLFQDRRPAYGVYILRAQGRTVPVVMVP